MNISSTPIAMKTTIFSVLLLMLLFLPARSRGQNYPLPKGSLLVETRALPSKARAGRALLLWMINPSRNPRETGEPYTCPEETRGSYYSGPTRVSLVDTGTGRIINTLEIRQEYMEGADSFDIPYRIHDGYYHVRGVARGKEGKPAIMWLRDYNGDGRAQEFALYDALACMGLPTTLIGYSESKDRVIQYAVEVEVFEGRGRSQRTTYWPDYLFSRQPQRPGYWQYEIDYRGRAGSLDKWEIRYNRQRERFEGSVRYIMGE